MGDGDCERKGRVSISEFAFLFYFVLFLFFKENKAGLLFLEIT